jgi:hypothetical protein
MKAYGRNSYDGCAFIEGGNVYSRKRSGRGNGKSGASQKRTDRAMKRRERKNNKIG